MINKVFLAGNLTKDAEALTTTGRSLTKMRLATNSRWRNADGVPQESVEFHSVVAFGRLAETAALYGHRGRRIFVEGRLRTRPYDAADGTRRYSTEVVADMLKLLGPRTDGGEVEADSDAMAGAPLEANFGSAPLAG